MFRALLYRLPQKQVICKNSSACITCRVRPSSLVGVDIATRAFVHGPHPSIKINSACSFRGFMSIARKPKNPEDPNALKGDMLGVSLTERAIEKLRTLSEHERDPKLGLRVIVEPGGCHGYVYKLELSSEYEDDDFVFVESNARVIVDSVTLALIKGSTIDYVTELIGSQFAIVENPQAKGSGCGCGVSWEPIL